MIQVFKHTTLFLFLLTASLSIRAQNVVDSFDDCSERACGFINIYDNAENIPPLYCSASGFSEELAAVNKDEKWGYIDASNNVVIDFQFDYARSFKQGGAVVRKGNFYGVINKEGKFVIPPHYYDLITLELESKQYYISRDSTFFQGIIDSAGKEILPHQYTFIIAYEGNLSKQRFYENIPFYTAFQAIDTSKGSFYEQFKEASYQFSPEKGRQDIYDLQFNKLASRNSSNYEDGFQHDELRRIDGFLKENKGLSIAEKVKKVDSLLTSPGPDKQDTTDRSTSHLKYEMMDDDEIKAHLNDLGYRLFTNGEGKTGLKKGRNTIIPAQYKFIKLLNGMITDPQEEDTPYLEKNYGGAYRSKEKGIFDIFLIAASDDKKQGYLYSLSGKKILLLEKGKSMLGRITKLGFECFVFKEDTSIQHGLLNWKGEKLLPPVYKSIKVLRTGHLFVRQEKKTKDGVQEHVGLYTKTGEVVIPPGVYSEIKPFDKVDNLYLAIRSNPYPTVEEKKASRHDNKDYVILKVEGNAYTETNKFTANIVSTWSLDEETGMLYYRQNKRQR
ncbi:WG repeat protein [Anseongella ginsenosidimutans]|uniref:WG repeat protein n=1 Tax=Anseongella ginsenosidimutans TaxID=496056 RepID=A0A4R3KPF7_9SPHI|nr:WG repeat-containing protein [Anseongella ginsenosidimutans]QEC53912.1 WG repeat-containing protein [Anseongella ginsenosidimutans]TCS86299.1 WG repeat protein [Anseongella ginsenosidimutans]